MTSFAPPHSPLSNSHPQEFMPASSLHLPTFLCMLHALSLNHTDCRCRARGLKACFSRVLLTALVVIFTMTLATWAIHIRLLLNDLKTYIPLLFLPDINTNVAAQLLATINGPCFIIQVILKDIIVSHSCITVC